LGIRYSKAQNFLFNPFTVFLDLVDVREAFTELGSLFTRNCAIDCGLDFANWMLAALIYEGRDIERLTRVVENMLGDGSGGFAEYIRENIVELKVGNGQAIPGAIFLPDQTIGQFETLAHQIAEVSDVRRRDKARLDHIAHEQVTNPLGILAVGLVALLRLGVLRVRERDQTGLLKDVEYGNPVFP
jgi:hypothetical protein